MLLLLNLCTKNTLGLKIVAIVDSWSLYLLIKLKTEHKNSANIRENI